jgi:hypothetical protein
MVNDHVVSVTGRAVCYNCGREWNGENTRKNASAHARRMRHYAVVCEEVRYVFDKTNKTPPEANAHE